MNRREQKNNKQLINLHQSDSMFVHWKRRFFPAIYSEIFFGKSLFFENEISWNFLFLIDVACRSLIGGKRKRRKTKENYCSMFLEKIRDFSFLYLEQLLPVFSSRKRIWLHRLNLNPRSMKKIVRKILTTLRKMMMTQISIISPKSNHTY